MEKTMEQCAQGADVTLRANGQLMMKSQSRASNGLLGGHGKFTKLRIDDSDAVIGAALRACLSNRNPGFYVPRMYNEKEKEAYQAKMAEYHADRGVASDEEYFRGAKGVGCSEYSDRIEFLATDNSIRKHAWLKNPPHVVVPLNASDLELAKALRQALDMCII